MRLGRKTVDSDALEAERVTAADIEDVPAGYQPAILMSDSMMGLMCGVCGGNVARRNAELHSAWHQRIGAI